MISHKKKLIFIHIPKCAGSSIRDFYFDTPNLDWRTPNYEFLYGWCPKRRIHLQHATPKELIETGLISQEEWNSYFKFAFVRNPWDRAYSDYLWIQKDRKVKGSFFNYLNGIGEFESIMNDNTVKYYRGDHLREQVAYVLDKEYVLDFIGKFENLTSDINKINEKMNFSKVFDVHEKKNTNRFNHYSQFYTGSKKRLVDKKYFKDINNLGYSFEDKRKGLNLLKKYI